MFSRDHDLLFGRDQVATLLNHLRASHFPRMASPVKRIRLPTTFNHDSALARTFGHRLGHVSRVNVAVRLVVQRTFQVLGPDQRPFRLDLIWGHPFIRDITGFSGGRIQHVFIHTLLGLGHAQVANNCKTSVQASLCL